MFDLTGHSLKDALSILSKNQRYIIKIIKLIGVNKKFNMLTNPYVVKYDFNDNYIRLYITYY